MSEYQWFAIGLSMFDALLYAALVAIAVRRAHFRDRRRVLRTVDVADNARRVEGPLLTILLVLALSSGISAFLIGTPEYLRIAGFTTALLRGLLAAVGLLVAYGYWLQRATWR